MLARADVGPLSTASGNLNVRVVADAFARKSVCYNPHVPRCHYLTPVRSTRGRNGQPSEHC